MRVNKVQGRYHAHVFSRDVCHVLIKRVQFLISGYVSSFQIMATSTYGSANGDLVKSAKMKSVKAISSVVSEKQGYK